MILSSLDIKHIRLYTKKHFDFSSHTTIIAGPNAAGKTNILESIFFLATGKSFRSEKDSEVIQFGEEVGRIKGSITMRNETMNNEEVELELVLTPGMVMGVKTPIKKHLVNGVPRRSVDFAGNLKAVLFWPQDMELVTDSPSIRRRYMDFVLMQVDREYRRSVLTYEKAMRQRNKLLEMIRDQGASRSQLAYWDVVLINTGGYIEKKRTEYIEYVNKYRIQNGEDGFPEYSIFYDKSVISRERLLQYKDAEVGSATTLVGPHRDDIEFRISKDEHGTSNIEIRDLSKYGSRGEQRLAILWLKLAELSFIEEVSGQKPVLLLDDIFSELDAQHRSVIFDIIGKQQSILTTTDLAWVDQEKLHNAQIIELGE
jgi:DNA replication and repair protein RecF